MTWAVKKNSWQYTSIYGADGKRLFLMDLEDWGVDEDNQDALEIQQEAIARLASSAPALLEALRYAADFIRDAGYGDTFQYRDAMAKIATAEGQL